MQTQVSRRPHDLVELAEKDPAPPDQLPTRAGRPRLPKQSVADD